MARMLPREAENGVGMNRSYLPGEESVKRFERSNGLDTALFKTIPFYLFLHAAYTDTTSLTHVSTGY